MGTCGLGAGQFHQHVHVYYTLYTTASQVDVFRKAKTRKMFYHSVFFFLFFFAL